MSQDGVAQATKELVDREVRRIVSECYAEAVATLVAHRDQLARLAAVLVEKETLDEDEAYAAAGVARDGTTAAPPPRVLDAVAAGTGSATDQRLDR